jgi:hypothetical protein
MIKDIFASLTSITNGIHRDKKTDREYKELNTKIKTDLQYKTPPHFKIDFSERDFGSKRKYYKALIDLETNNKFNTLIEDFPKDALEFELNFIYQKKYSQFKKYLKDLNTYINNYNFKRDTIDQENTFVIQYLKANAIWLFLELQERFSKYGNEDELTIEEVYKHYFKEVLSEYDIQQNTNINKQEEQIIPLKQHIKTSKKTSKRVSFGFKHRNKEQLKVILKELVLKIDLIDENRTSIDDLYSLLTTTDFTPIKTKIYLSCETTQFRYILDVFKTHFTNLTPTSVNDIGLFYTKNNILLKKSNLYKNNVFEPKEKTTIDEIINQMQ